AWAAVTAQLVAVKVRNSAVSAPAAGVPDNTPVVGSKVRPLGTVPVTDSVGVGVPVAVTVKESARPTLKVAALALVMAGATFTFRSEERRVGEESRLVGANVRAKVDA